MFDSNTVTEDRGDEDKNPKKHEKIGKDNYFHKHHDEFGFDRDVKGIEARLYLESEKKQHDGKYYHETRHHSHDDASRPVVSQELDDFYVPSPVVYVRISLNEKGDLSGRL